MLMQYQKRAHTAGWIFLACAVAIVALPALFGPKLGNSYDEFGLADLTVATGSMVYGFCSYAKAKGYSGWVGVILPLFSIVGLFVLLALKDNYKQVATVGSE